MKTLANDEIIKIITNCTTVVNKGVLYCELYCPLFKECRYYFLGEECGSALEQED